MAVKKVKRAGTMVSGHRVTGIQIKAALRLACIKQVEAGGCEVIDGMVTFNGKVAYATWALRGNVISISNGGRYGPKRTLKGDKARTFHINYPAFASEAVFTRAEADLIAAYTLHETAHVMYSNINPHEVWNAICNRLVGRGVVQHVYQAAKVIEDVTGCADPKSLRKQLFKIWNGIEDPRIEHSVIVAGRAAGASGLLARLLDKLTLNVDAKFNPTQLGSVPFALAVLGREALGHGNEWSAKLLARIPEPKRSIYADYMEKIKSLPLGYDKNCEAWLLAYEFAEAFGIANANMPEPQPQPSPPEPEDDEEDNEPQDDGDEPEDDEPEEGDQPSGGKPDDGDDDDEPSGPVDDGESEFEDKPEDDDAAEPPINPGEPSDSEEGDEEDDADTGSKTPGGGGDENGEQYDDRKEHGEDIESEPNVDEVFNRANDRGGAKEVPQDLLDFDRCDIQNYGLVKAHASRMGFN